MIEPWNDSSILPPPVLTSSSHSIQDAQSLLFTCQDIQRVLTNQSPLHKEAAILSRLVYKYDKKFRSDIGYKNFKKVNTALHKYLRLNFLKDVEQFQLVLPSQDADDDIYLPSRQMLEYLLTRLMAFSKIILRIYICSKCAAIFYLDRIKRGQGHWMSLIPYALLARVWSMSWVLVRHSCKWYKNLIVFQNKLQSKGLQFLPENYKLPNDLGEWLDIDNVDDIGRHNWSPVKATTVIPLLEEVDEQETSFDILNYVSDINSDNIAEIELTRMHSEQVAIHVDEDKSLHSSNLSSSSVYKARDKAEDLGDPVIKNVCEEKRNLPKTSSQHFNQNVDLGQAISRKSSIFEKTKTEPHIDKPRKAPNSQKHRNNLSNDNAADLGEAIKRNEHEEIRKLPKVSSQQLNRTEDLGHAVSRENYNIDKTKEKLDEQKPQDTSKRHSIDRITNTQTLTQFLELEEAYRNEDNNNSLTSHLSFMQWQALKNNLMPLCDSKANSRKIQRKFQKIWKQKCLAYVE